MCDCNKCDNFKEKKAAVVVFTGVYTRDENGCMHCGARSMRMDGYRVFHNIIKEGKKYRVTFEEIK